MDRITGLFLCLFVLIGVNFWNDYLSDQEVYDGIRSLTDTMKTQTEINNNIDNIYKYQNGVIRGILDILKDEETYIDGSAPIDGNVEVDEGVKAFGEEFVQ